MHCDVQYSDEILFEDSVAIFKTKEHTESTNLTAGNFHWGGGRNIWDTGGGGHCRKDKFHGWIVFLQGGHIISWFDLEACYKVIEVGTIGHHIYNFLLVFYNNWPYLLPFLHYSPHNFMPK